jgi:hypothetical protein
MPKKKPVASVSRGEVFAAFVEEGVQVVRELGARRIFCEQAGEFLKSKGLLEEFEAFRTDLNKGTAGQ